MPIRQAQQERYKSHVEEICKVLIDQNAVDRTSIQVNEARRLDGDMYGCILSFSYNEEYNFVCLGDLSCTCKDNAIDICMHVQAAFQCVPERYLGPAIQHLIMHTAKMDSSDGPPVSIKDRFRSDRANYEFKKIPAEDNVYECWPTCFGVWCPFPRDGQKPFPYIVNLEDGQCTCHMYRLAGVCPHLIGIFDALYPNESDSENPFVQNLRYMDGFKIERENDVNEEALSHLEELWQQQGQPAHAHVENITTSNQRQHEVSLSEVKSDLVRAKRVLGPSEQDDYYRHLKRHSTTWWIQYESSHSQNSESNITSAAHDPNERIFYRQVRPPSSQDDRSSDAGQPNETPTGDLTAPRPVAFPEGSQIHRVLTNFRTCQQNDMPAPENL